MKDDSWSNASSSSPSSTSRASSPPSSLVRESAEVFVRRRGGAASLARLVLPEQLVLDLGGEARLRVRPTGTGTSTTADLLDELAPACECFALASVGPGLLLVERHLARQLLSSLTRFPLAAESQLSRIERGVVGGFAAASLAKLGLSVGLLVDNAAVPTTRSEVVYIRALVDLASVVGQVWLCATAEGVAGWWPTSRLSLAPMPLRLELARTRISKGEVVAAAIGDLVVFDETEALSPSSSWGLDVCLGVSRVRVRLALDGAVLTDDDTAATSPIRRPRNSGTASEPAEITAEIARSNGPTAEPSPNRRDNGVILCVDRSDWAEGMLAEHDGRLAVRLTRMTTASAG